MTPAEMKIGGRYNWKNQPERLIYLGKNKSGNGYWHQFALVNSPNKVWSEVLDAELSSFEESQPAQQPDREPCGWRKKYNGEWAYAFSEDAWEFIRRGTPASGQSPDAPKRVMKVVPAEPTEEMISAANRTCRNDEQCKAKWEPSNCKLCRDDTAEDLRAALKVAPHETPCTTLSDEDKAILEAVRRELDDGDRKNAPGHAHQIPGIWDSDNGKKAGKPCAWCLTWSKFTALIDRDTSSNKQESP